MNRTSRLIAAIGSTYVSEHRGEYWLEKSGRVAKETGVAWKLKTLRDRAVDLRIYQTPGVRDEGLTAVLHALIAAACPRTAG